MHCEMCGREIEKGFLIEIEGSRLVVCEKCAEHGTIITQTERKTYKNTKETTADLVMNFGKRIREGRKKKGLSLEELSKLSGIGVKALKLMEEERIYPTLEQARKLESLLDIELIEESDIDYSPPKDFTLTLGDVVRVR